MNVFACTQVWAKQVDRSVRAVRAQAPAARMVGEFVVRQITQQLSRRISSVVERPAQRDAPSHE